MAKEVRLVIAGTEYREGSIVTLSTHRQLFEGAPSIGNCITGELEAELRIPSATIPRNAEFRPYTKDPGEGVWHPRSVFYVYQREIDMQTNTVHITAYDASFRADRPFIQSNEDINMEGWPRTAYSVMTDIANRCGITICAETLAILRNDSVNVRFPGAKVEADVDAEEETFVYEAEGDAAMTMREVAGEVARMYSSNLTIDNNGEWRFIRLGDIPLDSDYIVTENREIIILGAGDKEVRLLAF